MMSLCYLSSRLFYNVIVSKVILLGVCSDIAYRFSHWSEDVTSSESATRQINVNRL